MMIEPEHVEALKQALGNHLDQMIALWDDLPGEMSLPLANIVDVTPGERAAPKPDGERVVGH